MPPAQEQQQLPGVARRVEVAAIKEAFKDKATLEAAALADEKVQAFLAGATPKKVIVVPGKLVNLVVQPGG